MFKSRNSVIRLGGSRGIEKKYRRFKVISLIVIALLGGALAILIYGNFDYLVLKYLIADNYIYTDSLDELYESYLGTEAQDSNGNFNYRRDFDALVTGIVTERVGQIAEDRYTYLYTSGQYTLYQEAVKAVAEEAYYKELDSETVYLSLPNISKYTSEFIESNKEELNAYSNIIIDLQGNSGGSLDALYDMAGLFLDKGMIIGTEDKRIGLFSSTHKSKSARYFDFEQIILLQDSSTASAAEGFIMALSENLEEVTIIGEQSFGKGIGQITIDLKRGYAVKATIMQIGTPSGGTINRIGIAPDVEFTADENSGQSAVDAALKLLQ